MSNTETRPDEVACGGEREGAPRILEPRDVPLGGPRAMAVRRTLPQRERTLIGAWCFVDHYGPSPVAESGGMVVPGHPHTGLQTASWLFEGRIEHRDTTGAHAVVEPGELDLMTAGRGIAHSEHSTPDTVSLHGVQLWIALPESARFEPPRFERFRPPLARVGGVDGLVFLGSLDGTTSPVRTATPLLGAELRVPAGAAFEADVPRDFELGVLVDAGAVSVAGLAAGAGELAFLPPGRDRIRIEADGDADARVLLLGGPPFGEEIVMWWNLIGRSHEEVVRFRDDWQAQRASRDPDGRFGAFPDAWASTLPAPELPNVRLRLRR